MMTRRRILQAMLAAAGLGLTPLPNHAWALTADKKAGRRFIFILMRGAVDGLSIVAPYTEVNYYDLRPTIAIAKPGETDGLLDLDGFFGMHPSLAALLPFWQNRSLAFIHASGSTAETRSHFEAQDIIETALLNSALAKQGWMNGLARLLPDNHSPTKALSVGNVTPKIYQGPTYIASLPFNMRPEQRKPKNNQLLESKLQTIYAPHPELAALYRQALSAQDMLMQDLQGEMEAAGKGAPAGDQFVNMARHVANMLRNDANMQLVFMDAGGWDTHVGQGNGKGQLANRLEKFGQGIRELADGLGPIYADTLILIMSEFGRTIAENGNKGTDHGHGNVAWLLGGRVNGGKVHGKWPGLDQEAQWEKRDLAITTDFRSIIGQVIGKQFDLNEGQIKSIIADYAGNGEMGNLID